MDSDFEKAKTKVLDFTTASGKACVVKQETFLASEAWLQKQNDDGDDFDDDSAFENKDEYGVRFGIFDIWKLIFSFNNDIFMDDSGKGSIQDRSMEVQKQFNQNIIQRKPRGVFTNSVENVERDLHSPTPTVFEGFPVTPMVQYKSNPKVNKWVFI